MKRILNYINDLTLDENTEQIIRGEIETGLIMNQVSQFNRWNHNQQNQYMVKLNDRSKQITKPYKLLTVLLLVDNIIKNNTEIELPPMSFPNLKEQQSKESIILTNIANYYHRFIHYNSKNRYNKYTLNAEEELEEAENFCELAIKKIMEFIKLDFVFSHAWNKLLEHRMLLKQIVGSILDRFREDLSILNTFVKNNIELVLQKTVKHPLIFQINNAYEKLIFINKEMNKINRIATLYNFKVDFPRYEIDLELNKQIEMEMLERKEEKKLFFENRAKAEVEARKQRDYNCYLEDEIDVHVRTSQSFLLLDQEQE